jgi:hypothetical protein
LVILRVRVIGADSTGKYMLRLPLLVMLVLVLCGNAGAEIVFDRTEVDLGYIYRDQPQEMVYDFTNISADSLNILDIEPSCDCTTAQVLPNPVPPRGDGRVYVFFDPMGYEDRGPFTEYVRLLTSSPAQPEVLLTFSIEVGIGPETYPRSLAFGAICQDRSDTLDLLLYPTPGETLGVLEAYADTACLYVERLGADDRGTHKFRVVATNRKGCGRVASFVNIVTADSLRKQIRVPVTLSLLGHIIVEPDVIAFGPTLPGAFVAQTVDISSRDKKPLELPRVACSVDYIEPDISATGSGSYRLRLRIKEDAPAGMVHGTVTLMGDCPEDPPLDIKLTGYVRSRK